MAQIINKISDLILEIKRHLDTLNTATLLRSLLILIIKVTVDGRLPDKIPSTPTPPLKYFLA